MKLVIQRVASASVEVEKEVISRIGPGLVVLLGIQKGDTMDQVEKLARKVVKLRLWPSMDDAAKPWVSSLKSTGYEVLVVSQFTLVATFSKPKPNYNKAMGGEGAQVLYNSFLELLKKDLGDSKVAAGSFGAMMTVELRNDGPVTVELVAEPPAPPAEGQQGKDATSLGATCGYVPGGQHARWALMGSSLDSRHTSRSWAARSRPGRAFAAVLGAHLFRPYGAMGKWTAGFGNLNRSPFAIKPAGLKNSLEQSLPVSMPSAAGYFRPIGKR